MISTVLNSMEKFEFKDKSSMYPSYKSITKVKKMWKKFDFEEILI